MKVISEFRPIPHLLTVAAAVLPQNVISFGRDPVAHVPKLFVKEVLHPLMKNFHRRTHCAHYASADNPLCQFEVMKTKQVDAFIEIEQPFGHIM